MNIQQSGPEPNQQLIKSWRDLKWKLRLERLVFFASLFSTQTMIARRSDWWLLPSVSASMLAIHLAVRFIKTFRCPRCGHRFYGPRSHPGIGPHAAKACSHCELPLWSLENDSL